jgi:hypothetical protein
MDDTFLTLRGDDTASLGRYDTLGEFIAHHRRKYSLMSRLEALKS